MPFGCAPRFLGADAALGPPCRLEEPWRRLLPNGELFCALVLSTLFSEKYKGRNMAPGDTAEVRVPGLPGEEPKVWRPTLLHRAGSKEGYVFIWRGDESSQFPTIYLAFSPLRKKMQFFKVAFSGSSVLHETFQSGPAQVETGANGGAEHSVRMLSYVHKKLQNLWQKYGFQEVVEKTLADYPNHLLLCCGLSHGASLAQAAVLRLSLAYPRSSFQAVTWNAYKFLDEDGVALFKQAVGKRLLPFVMSRRSYWDSVAGAPYDLEPVPNIVFLDADNGSCRPAGDVKRSRFTVCSIWRAYMLHFAKTALKAMRLATSSAVSAASSAPISNASSRMERLKTIQWPSRGLMRSWSYVSDAPWCPLVEQERELAKYERLPVSDDEDD